MVSFKDLCPPLLSRLDVSLGDWVQREQQELKEVEETLERTAGILEVSVRSVEFSTRVKGSTLCTENGNANDPLSHGSAKETNAVLCCQASRW